MSQIGSVLKEARERKSFSLDDVHSRIKIHPRVLELLEEEKFDKLPSPIFVKSFLKAYADFLEIDSDGLVRSYEKVGVKEPEQTIYIKPAEEANRKNAGFDPKVLLMPAIAVVVIIVGVLIFNFAVGFNNPKKAKKSRTPRATTSSAKLSPKKIVVAGNKKTALAPAVSAPSVAATPKSEAPKPASEWLRSASQGNFPDLNKKQPLDLQVKALDNVWMRVTCDGRVLFQSILKRGASESWSGAKEIEIWTGNSSNMFLTLNNYGIGSPGKGVVKKMLITHEGVRIVQPVSSPS